MRNDNEHNKYHKVSLTGNGGGGSISGLNMTIRHFSYKLHEKLLIGSWYVKMQQLKLKFQCQ